MSSVRTILASLFTVLGGFCLLVLTTGAGFAIYFWTITDSVSAPAQAAAMPHPPVVKAESGSSAQSNVPRFASAALVETSMSQGPKAPASQAPASVVSTNNNPAISNGQTPIARPPQTAAIRTDDTADTSSAMLTRAWAPAAMLVPAKDPNEAPEKVVSDASAPNFNRPNSVLASNDQTATEPQPAPAAAPGSTVYFEGGTPVPAAQTEDPAAVAARSAADVQPGQPSKTKKTKTARRRPAKDETVETTISKGFDTLQKSISSMF